MKNKGIMVMVLAMVVNSMALSSAIVVDADFVTFYSGEEKRIELEVENNENFDIEDVSVVLILDALPFTSVGSSEKSVDDIDEDDDERVSFTLRASTDATPGDYNIPYMVSFTNEEDNEALEAQGAFGVRIGAQTELDFSAYPSGTAIVGQSGEITFEVINEGLGDVKSFTIELFPDGFTLLSKEKVFIGTVDSDDTDIASFDVIYERANPTFNAQITYKDFDNNDQVQTITLPFKVYTPEEAKALGLVSTNNTFMYVIILGILLVAFLVYRRMRKRRRNAKKKSN